MYMLYPYRQSLSHPLCVYPTFFNLFRSDKGKQTLADALRDLLGQLRTGGPFQLLLVQGSNLGSGSINPFI
jgi:hypothetical protein